MKIRTGAAIVVAMLVSESLLAGMIDSGKYQAVVSAQTNGFNALAHDIFAPGAR